MEEQGGLARDERGAARGAALAPRALPLGARGGGAGGRRAPRLLAAEHLLPHRDLRRGRALAPARGRAGAALPPGHRAGAAGVAARAHRPLPLLPRAARPARAARAPRSPRPPPRRWAGITWALGRTLAEHLAPATARPRRPGARAGARRQVPLGAGDHARGRGRPRPLPARAAAGADRRRDDRAGDRAPRLGGALRRRPPGAAADGELRRGGLPRPRLGRRQRQLPERLQRPRRPARRAPGDPAHGLRAGAGSAASRSSATSASCARATTPTRRRSTSPGRAAAIPGAGARRRTISASRCRPGSPSSCGPGASRRARGALLRLGRAGGVGRGLHGARRQQGALRRPRDRPGDRRAAR